MQKLFLTLVALFLSCASFATVTVLGGVKTCLISYDGPNKNYTITCGNDQNANCVTYFSSPGQGVDVNCQCCSGAIHQNDPDVTALAPFMLLSDNTTVKNFTVSQLVDPAYSLVGTLVKFSVDEAALSDLQVNPNPIVNHTADVEFAASFTGTVTFLITEIDGSDRYSTEVECSPGANAVSVELPNTISGNCVLNLIKDNCRVGTNVYVQ